MKNLRPRAVPLILALVIFMASFAGCSASRPIKSTDEELAVVGQVGGFDVLYEELRYVTINYKKQLESEYGEGIWENDATAEVYRAGLRLW